MRRLGGSLRRLLDTGRGLEMDQERARTRTGTKGFDVRLELSKSLDGWRVVVNGGSQRRICNTVRT